MFSEKQVKTNNISLNTKQLGERLTIGPAGRFCASLVSQLCVVAARMNVRLDPPRRNTCTSVRFDECAMFSWIFEICLRVWPSWRNRSYRAIRDVTVHSHQVHSACSSAARSFRLARRNFPKTSTCTGDNCWPDRYSMQPCSRTNYSKCWLTRRDRRQKLLDETPTAAECVCPE